MKISVAICTYNGEKFLSKQLDSILNQTVEVQQIIICDDQSSDQTQYILKKFKELHPEFIYIYNNDQRLGSIKNFEKCLQICSGEIIFLSDQDDIWEVNKVEKYLDYFSINPNISVICSNGYVINKDDEIINNIITLWDIPFLLKKNGEEINYFHTIAYCGNIATGASMAIRRDFLNKIIPFPKDSKIHHDEWIASIASFYNEFAFIDEKLFRYRIHENQQIGKIYYSENKKQIQKLLNRFSSGNLSYSVLKRKIKKTGIIYKVFLDHDQESMITRSIKIYYDKIKIQFLSKFPILGKLHFLLKKIN